MYINLFNDELKVLSWVIIRCKSIKFFLKFIFFSIIKSISLKFLDNLFILSIDVLYSTTLDLFFMFSGFHSYPTYFKNKLILSLLSKNLFVSEINSPINLVSSFRKMFSIFVYNFQYSSCFSKIFRVLVKPETKFSIFSFPLN
jgi:hypothetical protein